MKKLISILSAILLMIAFSIPCASEDGPGSDEPIKIKARKTVKFKKGPDSGQNASLESSSVYKSAETLDSSQVGFGTFHKTRQKERKGRNPSP